MAKIIDLVNEDEVKPVKIDLDGSPCYDVNEQYCEKPFFKTSDGEILALSDLELVCVEPVTVGAEQIKNKAHEEIALNAAKKYNLPYVKLSEYCFSSAHPVQFIGGEGMSVHTYLAQFYRTRPQQNHRCTTDIRY